MKVRTVKYTSGHTFGVVNQVTVKIAKRDLAKIVVAVAATEMILHHRVKSDSRSTKWVQEKIDRLEQDRSNEDA